MKEQCAEIHPSKEKSKDSENLKDDDIEHDKAQSP